MVKKVPHRTAERILEAWFFMHTLFEWIWQYRFPSVLNALERAGAMRTGARTVEPTATNMVVVLTYWLSYEYVLNPRRALEPEYVQAALLRGAHHVVTLLMPYLGPGQRTHLLALASAYQPNSG